MADNVVLISISDSESSHSPPSPLQRRCRRRQTPPRRPLPPPAVSRRPPGRDGETTHRERHRLPLTKMAALPSQAGTGAARGQKAWRAIACVPGATDPTLLVPLSPQEIIDLTYEDTSTVPGSRFTIIDLTEDTCSPPQQDPRQAPVTPTAHMSHPQFCSTPVQEMEAVARSYPAEPSATIDRAESCSSSTSSYRGSSCSPEENCSTTTLNSDLGSLASMPLGSDLLSPSPSSLDSSSSDRASGSDKDSPHPCQQSELPLKLSPAPAIPTTAQGPFQEAGDLPPHEVIQQVTPTRTKADSKAWLNKLQYFRSSGVQHLFLQGVAPNRETHQQKTELIPSGKLNMVRTTMEENFLEGTLHFLNDFVSCQHYPPKEIISHLIRRILLNPHQKEMLKDTYMLLMKIQMVHPANAATVGWDWMLLKYTMEDQEKPPGWVLFLQYVVQTLEDDFQHNLRLRMLQKSIAKKVLSCDTCFNNVKEVVEWLVAAVTGVGFSEPQEQPQETTSSSPEDRAKHSSSAPQLTSTAHAEVAPPTFFTQKVMLLLQRMLSIAVEVDKSPNCSSCKIADVIFPFILNIPLRSQREAFLNTMESQLLRCKLLEQLFQHSCDVPTTLPLSLAKILHFLSYSSVLLPYQDETATWQRWDEMLEYLNLLLMSYQNVIVGHLRSSLNDRMDLIIQKVKPRVQADDDISQLDLQLKIQNLISRMQQVLEQPFPLQITEKLRFFQELFLVAAT
ncbi:SUMO-interacting motif-containing protein 1 [Indicator indicator]|uniref:SUMO-interacting motif-containing protein 1 n=1 Tax=Indicator indicator TaxID=1002788 RepID=UPI0023DF521E|nr:SUMO-interacting motif-containing protein 1 [Indicator indicator]